MPQSLHRRRELRKAVNLRARMRAGCGWSDASILNVSSSGLQIDTTRAAVQGGAVEIWHGEHVIVAQVVWSKGTRAGLTTEQQVPVEELMRLSSAPQLQASWPEIERRRRPRSHGESHTRARAAEFASVIVIAVWVALGTFATMQQAFAEPLAYIGAMLSD